MHQYGKLASLLLGLSFLAASHSTAHCKDFDMESLQSDVLKTIERVRPAVVHISSGRSAFSGVIVSPEGHVLSAGHAVTPKREYRITLPNGRRYRGIGKGSNSRADSALLKILKPDDDLPYVPMGDSSSLVANQPCLGLSYPGGQRAGTEPLLRFGRVIRSGRGRSMLQTSVLMEPGDSGGPLFDMNGCVIGIRSRIGRAMEQNYDVPVNVFRDSWNELNREESFVQSEPSAPRLGIRCAVARDDEGKNVIGLAITSVVDGSLAAKIGLKPDDIIVQFYGREMKSIPDLRGALIDARDAGTESIKMQLKREDKKVDLEIDLAAKNKAAPKVPLPEHDLPEVPAPQGFKELARLASQLSDLESRVDDACITITSEFRENESRTITGTRVQGTRWVLSKNSAVGAKPTGKADGKTFPLSVIGRDTAIDLVLLSAPEIHKAGVDLGAEESQPTVGTFLLTPDHDGTGLVSLVSNPAFRSEKRESRGYLGVVPATFEGNKGAVLNEIVGKGAAEKAGLQVGDVVTKLNDKVVRTHSDMRRFLTQAEPNSVITATIRRDDEELTKEVTLDAFPSSSNHAADKMDKSGRRDGFRKVFPHDAVLKPDDCGGPLFDVAGKFVGLNIARYSRVRSYALPVSTLKEFVEQATAQATDDSAE